MAAGLHGSARTTPRVRAELQRAEEGTRALAARYGLNPKTVAKWRNRTTTADAAMGPTRPRSTTLTEAEEGPEQCSIGANFRGSHGIAPCRTGSFGIGAVAPGGDGRGWRLRRATLRRSTRHVRR